MTRRERFLAAMRFDPVDRIPWAPKIFFGYYLHGQAPKWRNMPWADLADYLGVEMMVWASPGRYYYTSKVEVKETRGCNTRTTVYDTPVGKLTSSMAYSESAQEWHPVEPLLKTASDYGVFRFILDNYRLEANPQTYLDAENMVGDRGIVFISGPSTPFMRLLQFEIDLPETYYHLQDYPEELSALLEQMTEMNCGFYRQIVETTPGDNVMIVENTSTTLTSPSVYLDYCQPVMLRYIDIIKDAGKVPSVHMCGHLLDLLPEIAKLKVAAVEAYSPPPVGNTRLIDGRRAFEHGTAMIGGLNAVLLEKLSIDDLCHWVQAEVGELPEKTGVVLTSGGIHPPDSTVERIKQMSDRFRPILCAN